MIGVPYWILIVLVGFALIGLTSLCVLVCMIWSQTSGKARVKSYYGPLAVAVLILGFSFPAHAQLNCSGGCGGTGYKVISATKNLTDANNATQSFTGCGFAPTAVIMFAALNSSDRGSWGIGSKLSVSAARGMSIPNGTTGFFASPGSNIIQISDDGGGNVQSAAGVTSWDADGITITWSKTGTPSGSVDITVMCLK